MVFFFLFFFFFFFFFGGGPRFKPNLRKLRIGHISVTIAEPFSNGSGTLGELSLDLSFNFLMVIHEQTK
jgi:hypothetical protein